MSALRVATALVIVIVCGGVVGCRTPGAAPVGSPLVRHTRLAPIVPDEADHAAANLAAAALVSDRARAARELEIIEAVDRGRRRGDLPPTGLAAQAEDLLNATLFGGRSYRDATEELLDRDDLTEELRARLERDHADDPLALAKARVHDARMIQVARLFNAVSEPAGHAILTTTFAPYKFAQSAVVYMIQIAKDDPLPLQRRQALAHWKRFLARYPDAEESAGVARQVSSAEKRWRRTRRDHALHIARRALSKGRSRLALYQAERALRHMPEDRAAEKVRTKAVRQVRAEEERVRWSVQFEPDAAGVVLPAGSRELAVAMLEPHGDLDEASRALPQNSPLRDELRFARATLRGEAGDDTGMWSDLREMSEEDDEHSNMLRHAQAELGDSVRNPYDGFQRARGRDRLGKTVWVMLGPAAVRPEWSIAGVAEWLVRLPSRVQAVVTLPLRLAQLPFAPPPRSATITAVQARRYLALRPGGQRAEEVRGWLESYERRRQNWLGALRVAKERPEPSGREIEELREKAAKQALGVAAYERRRDLRHAMLHHVTREFPDTRAGREAGVLAREEAEKMTAHQVRISRGFLNENPDVAGPGGLGLEPALLDGDASNGELHPEGVTLVGGRRIRLSFIGAAGDEDEDPQEIVTAISDEHLARLVSRLEEASFHNSLVDEDDHLAPHAQRDLLFERARLGLADQQDDRAAAEVQFAYEGVRERYGMVRSRKPILPFDIVVQGSLTDLSLGAFPRMRAPRTTPDAMLYQ